MKSNLFPAIRLFAVLALLCPVFTAVHGQVAKGGPRFGIKLGLNGADFYDDVNARNFDNNIGFAGGIFLKAPILGRFSLRPELLYTRKGGQYDFTNGDHPNLSLGYFEVPVSLEANFLRFINLHVGAHTAMLVSADGSVTDAKGNDVDFKFDRDDFEKIDYGWHVGGGLDFGNIGLHLRFSRGLKGIGKFDQYIGTLKNSTWTLSVSAAL